MSETGNKEQLVMRIFHPIHERSRDAWFPGDDDTSLLVAALHAWEDIERLTRLRTQVQDGYDRKLLLKYVIIEVRSLIDLMDRLRAKVMSADTYVPGQKPLYRGIIGYVVKDSRKSAPDRIGASHVVDPV